MGEITIAANTALIFGTLAGCDNYFALSLRGDDWTAAADETRQKALVSATRWLLRLCPMDENGNAIEPNATDDGTPEQLVDGVYELANHLLANQSAVDSETTGSNIKAVKAGSAEVSFFRASQGRTLPTVAYQLLSKYLPASSLQFATYFTDTDQTSNFEDADRFARSRGFS